MQGQGCSLCALAGLPAQPCPARRYNNHVLQLIVSSLYIPAALVSVFAASFARVTGRKVRAFRCTWRGGPHSLPPVALAAAECCLPRPTAEALGRLAAALRLHEQALTAQVCSSGACMPSSSPCPCRAGPR